MENTDAPAKKRFLLLTATRTAFFMLAGMILFFSLIPNPPQPDIRWPYLDKLEHFTAYFLLALLGVSGFCRGKWRAMGGLTGGLIGISGIIELIQPFTGRHFELADLGINALGSLLGGVLATIVLRERRR